MRFFRLPNRADAVVICRTLQQRRVFVPMDQSLTEFQDSNAYYEFPEDEFDQYIQKLPAEQYSYIHSLIIGPLGVGMNQELGTFIKMPSQPH